MKKRYLVGLACGVMVVGMVGMAGATLITIGTAVVNDATLLGNGNLGGPNNLIYDSDLGITWLDISFGQYTWAGQNWWANSLNNDGVLTVSLYDGYTADWGSGSVWRLPDVGSNPNVGYNQTSSEMGHLFYVELDNYGNTNYGIDGTHPGYYGLTNRGDFDHLISSWYWLYSDEALNGGQPWYFSFSDGEQDWFSSGTGNFGFGMAVRSGQVIYTPHLLQAIQSQNQPHCFS